jgi:DNA-binding response OmpR family regulator
MQTVLIIDDDANHRLIYRLWLEKGEIPYRVIEAENTRDGMKLVITENPACVILDYMMKGESGFVMLHELEKSCVETPPVIFVSCAMTEELRRNALALGAVECFEKSLLNEGEFLSCVAKACHD